MVDPAMTDPATVDTLVESEDDVVDMSEALLTCLEDEYGDAIVEA